MTLNTKSIPQQIDELFGSLPMLEMTEEQIQLEVIKKFPNTKSFDPPRQDSCK